MRLHHYVLLRFQPDFFTDELYRDSVEMFRQIADAVPGIRSLRVHRNCIPRSTNYDIMVEIQLEGEEILKEYLGHPLHREYARVCDAHLAAKTSFDWSEDRD